MEKENWARLSKKHKEKIEHERNLSKDIGNAGSQAATKPMQVPLKPRQSRNTASYHTRKRYVIPKPGKNGALSANSQKKFALS